MVITSAVGTASSAPPTIPDATQTPRDVRANGGFLCLDFQ